MNKNGLNKLEIYVILILLQSWNMLNFYITDAPFSWIIEDVLKCCRMIVNQWIFILVLELIPQINII